MEHLSSSARAKAKLCLSQTIAAGQKLSWEISADLIHQFLVRAKRMATAKAKGKKPPRWRPLFTKVAAHKASFPPSQRTESYAASFLARGTAITSAAFAGEAASLGIPTALRADTWLRVLQMRVRLGKKGIASLVDNTPLADHGKTRLAVALRWRPCLLLCCLQPANLCLMPNRTLSSCIR